MCAMLEEGTKKLLLDTDGFEVSWTILDKGSNIDHCYSSRKLLGTVTINEY